VLRRKIVSVVNLGLERIRRALAITAMNQFHNSGSRVAVQCDPVPRAGPRTLPVCNEDFRLDEAQRSLGIVSRVAGFLFTSDDAIAWVKSRYLDTVLRSIDTGCDP
jgi:hypothetical protein